jgi:hypothetical protein
MFANHHFRWRLPLFDTDTNTLKVKAPPETSGGAFYWLKTRKRT